MSKETKRILGFITFGIVLYAALMNLGNVTSWLEGIFAMVLPVIAGLIIAFVLNVPMKAFEKLYKKLLGPRIKPRRDGRARKFYGISLLSTFVCVILVLFLMFTLLIPELVSSVTSWERRSNCSVPYCAIAASVRISSSSAV